MTRSRIHTGRATAYRTSIPTNAEERVDAWYDNGSKEAAEYFVDSERVGTRSFHLDGSIQYEQAWRNSRLHGTTYRFDEPGRLLSATPYSNGLEHGIARQWADDGRLLGTYRMRHGTGIDLWWDETWTKPRRRYLAEVIFMRRGRPHGYEWWLNEDQQTVYIERRWHDGQLHGIEREWNRQGRLRRGFPKYFVAGTQVTRRHYLKAAVSDASLPPFREQDNRPDRRFLPEVARHLGRRRKRRATPPPHRR